MIFPLKKKTVLGLHQAQTIHFSVRQGMEKLKKMMKRSRKKTFQKLQIVFSSLERKMRMMQTIRI